MTKYCGNCDSAVSNRYYRFHKDSEDNLNACINCVDTVQMIHGVGTKGLDKSD